jgi:hypothetical protein
MRASRSFIAAAAGLVPVADLVNANANANSNGNANRERERA